MTDKKQLLRKTVALVTSVVFLFSYTSRTLVIAEDAAVTEQVSETLPAESEVPDAESQITDDAAETVYPEVKPVEKRDMFIRFFMKTHTVADCGELIDVLYNNLETVAVYSDEVIVKTDADRHIDEYLKEEFKGNGRRFFTYKGSVFEMTLAEDSRLNSTRHIYINEFFDLSSVPSDVVVVTPKGTPYQEKYYQYDTELTVSAAKGWHISEDKKLLLGGPVSVILSDEFFRVQSGDGVTGYSAAGNLYKNEYTVSYPKTKDISMKINSADGFEYTGKWLDDEHLNIEVSSGESSTGKIYGARIVNSSSGESYDMKVTGDGKNITAGIDVSAFNTDSEHGEKYTVEFDTVPDTVSCKVYIADENGDKFYNDMELGTTVTDSEKFLEISPVLYENGVVKYIIDSYETDGNRTTVDTKKIYDSSELSHNITIEYGKNIKLLYNVVVQDTDVNWEVTDFCEIKNGTVYSGRKNPVNEILKFNRDIMSNIFYDILFDDYVLTNETRNDKIFKYIISNIQDNLQSINVKSIIYYSDGEFHNMLQEPLYFYFDSHAPEVKIVKQDDSEWNRKVFRFDIICDDREKFSESADFSEEVNDIYRNINGASSPVAEICIAGYRFIKENGKWKQAEGPKDDKYTISVTEKSEGEYSVSVSLADRSISSFENNIEVTVADSCGNRSVTQTADMKMENSAPYASSLKLENPVYYTDRVTGEKAAAFGLEKRSSSDRVNAYITAGDEHSGLSEVEITYNSLTYQYDIDELKANREYKFEGNSGSCSFCIPLDASENMCSELKLVLTDNVGNSRCYYYAGNETAPSVENGMMIFFDKTAPETGIVPASEEVYSDRSHGTVKNWYSETPDFKLTAADTAGGINTGTRFIEFEVNGKTVMSSDLTGKITRGAEIKSERRSDNPDLSDIYYVTDEGFREKITTVNSAGTDGGITVKFRAYDVAENVSQQKSVTVYTDYSAPSADNKYTLLSGDTGVRKFGTFLNHSEVIRVKVSEPDNRPSSGLKTAAMTFNGKEYICKLNSAGSATAEFEIPFDLNAFSDTAVITLEDNAGNRYVSEALLNSAGSETIVFENNPAVITADISAESEPYEDQDGLKWYRDNAGFSVMVNDETGKLYSGISSIAASVNGHEAYSKNYSASPEMKKSDSWSFNAGDEKYSIFGTDGVYSVNVNAADNAGNSASEKYMFAVDRTAPVITEILIGDEKSEQVTDAFSTLTVPPYSHFFREGRDVRVTAFDGGASAGLKEINLTLHESGGTVSTVSRPVSRINEDGYYTVIFSIPEGFKGYITADAADNVNHVSERFITHGVITENRERHDSADYAKVSIPDTEYTDRFGLKLYSGDVKTSFYAEDRFSGIRSFEMNSEDTDESWKNIIPDENMLQNADGSFAVEKENDDLVVSVKSEAVITKDQNGQSIRVRMADNAGNSSEDRCDFSIDRKPPVITVTYDDAASDKASGIYSDARTAYVSVNERNFDPDRIRVSTEGGDGGVNTGSWSLVSGTEGSDSAVYRMPVTFSGNGEYVLTAEGTDMGNNAAEKYESEKFVIDRTPPVLEIVSSGAELKNGFCWNAARTVTIRITEHNFDASRIRITGTVNGSSEKFPEVSEFVSSGDIHTAVIVFEENADYTFSVQGEDAAGNAMEGYSDTFTVDGAAPEIIFEGVKDRSASNGDVSLSVFIREDNASADMISADISGAARGSVNEMAGAVQKTEGGFRISFAEFEKTKAFDDIYTVKVHASDKAEHESDGVLVFSVNRFGSTYVFEEETLAIAGSYIRKPVDCILHEINVDRLDEDRTVVKVVRDNDTMVLQRETDYTVELEGGDGSWCDYRYVIKAKNFADDAAYRIEVCSVDAAGNKNANSIEEKKAELKFGVDQTPPRCTPVNIEKNGSYRTDSLSVQFICEDNIMMKSVAVQVDGTDITERVEGENSKYRFTLLSSDNPYDINFTLTDIAGNETNLPVDNVLVSTSYVKIVFHRLWQQIVPACAAAGLIIWGITAFVRRKRGN